MLHKCKNIIILEQKQQIRFTQFFSNLKHYLTFFSGSRMSQLYHPNKYKERGHPSLIFKWVVTKVITRKHLSFLPKSTYNRHSVLQNAYFSAFSVFTTATSLVQSKKNCFPDNPKASILSVYLEMLSFILRLQTVLFLLSAILW